MLCRTSATCQARSTSTSSRSPTQSNCVFVGGCGKSRVIAALQHFCGACWGVGDGERLRRPACSWAARRCTVCSAHSAPSQLSTSMRTTASRCTTEALKAVLEVLWMLVDGAAVDAGRDRQVLARCSLDLAGARRRHRRTGQGVAALRALAVGAVCRRARLHPQRDDHGAARRRSDADHTTGDGEDSMRALDEAPFRVGQASAACRSARRARQRSTRMQFRDVEPHRIWLAFLERAVVPEQRDARGDAPPLGRPRRRRSGAADDRRRRVWRRAACLLRWLRALRRRGRVYGDADVAAASRAAVPLGARLVRRAADLCVVESRAEAELSLNTTVQFADRARRRPPVRHDEAPVEKTLLGDESVEQECDVCRCAGSSSSLRNGSGVRKWEMADTCSSSTPPTAGRPRVKSNNERSNNVESRRASHCAVVWPNTVDAGPRGCGCGADLGCAACAALGVWLRRCQRRACRCRAPPPADSSSHQQSCASARRRAR
jgi:hypothetical protein